MKKSRIPGLLVIMTLVCTACGPGGVRVRDYAAQAQQVGELYFGESIAPVSLLLDSLNSRKTESAGAVAMNGTEEAAPEETAEEAAAAESETETAEAAVTAESETETAETAAAAENGTEAAAIKGSGAKTATAKKSAVKEEKAESETETEETPAAAESETESETETAETAATAAESETETEETAATAETETETEETAETEPEPAALPAGKLSDRVLAVMEEKAGLLAGKLVGRDSLEEAEQTALEAVWAQGGYGSRTGCLAISGDISGTERTRGCFLFLFDSSRVNAAGVLKGDLWYVCGGRVQNVLRGMQMEELRPLDGGDGLSLLVKGKQDGKACVRIVTGMGAGAVSRFTDALEIGETQEGLVVFYAPEYFRYDPVTEEWSAGEGGVPCYYARKGNGFEPLPVLEISQAEYLECLSAGEEDPEGQAWADAQEKRFSGAGDGTEYRFFRIGEDRIGYGVREIREDENGYPYAEYRYAVSNLQDGVLTAQGQGTEGEGFYFSDRQKKAAELAALDEVPERYARNRLDQARAALNAGERQALDAVLEEREYPADALCFVSRADFDGDRQAECFVALGSYDGAFGAPVCDLWYAGQDGVQLLEECCPMKGASLCRIGRNALYLWKGWGTDLLYGVQEKHPCRYLEEARRITVDEKGDIDAWLPAGEGSCPWPYRYEDGQVKACELYEVEPETLLDYENGAAVLETLRCRAPGGIFCMTGDNGLWYVDCLDADGNRRYEIYHVRDGELVLTGCGAGGYMAAGEDGGAGSSVPAEGNGGAGGIVPAEGNGGAGSSVPAEGNGAAEETAG